MPNFQGEYTFKARICNIQMRMNKRGKERAGKGHLSSLLDVQGKQFSIFGSFNILRFARES